MLFDANGRVKICDLGLIAERELRNGSEIDITRTIAGTLMYMAPEQVRNTIFFKNSNRSRNVMCISDFCRFFTEKK